MTNTEFLDTASNSDLFLHTRSGMHRLQLRVASSFWKRFLGLMFSRGLPPDTGLLLAGCSSVHTAFMRYPIDVLYLDRDGRVVKCVPALKPWRASASGLLSRALHTVELADGSIERWQIAVGDRLQGALDGVSPEHLIPPDPCQAPTAKAPETPELSGSRRINGTQAGAAIVEFTVVAPALLMMGLALLQYSMLFFAKNQINHASFMAARAGSMGNANLPMIRDAYANNLVLLYGGASNAAELVQARARAALDIGSGNGSDGYSRIEILSPTKESFDDFNDAYLQTKFNTSKRVIPNGFQALKDPNAIGSSSGQSIQDANLIKLRITYGFQPQVPLVRSVYTSYLKWADDLNSSPDPFYRKLLEEGRVPVVTHVTLQMHSDPIEDNNASNPGPGNSGTPTNPGIPHPPPSTPPDCGLVGCPSPDPSNPGDPTVPCTPQTCPICPGPTA